MKIKKIKITKKIKQKSKQKIQILDFLRLFLDFSVIFLYFSNALSNNCTVAWVTRPQRPKVVKDVIKQA